MHDPDGLIKVRFHLGASRTSGGWPPVDSEVFWARRLGELSARIDNIPFYAFGVSYCDMVALRAPDDVGVFEFERIIGRGGHSTYRVLQRSDLGQSDREFVEKLFSGLATLGCGTERSSDGVIAVDVPPESQLQAVYDVLELGLESGVWDFEEGYAFLEPADSG